MDYQPRPTGAPPSPVEPTGFFTGIQILPIIVGVVVDFIASEIARYAYFFVYLANELSKQGEVSPEVISKYMLTDEGLMIGFVIGTLGTALGGFVAARRAGKLEIKHGAFVGLGSLIVSAILEAMVDEPVSVPEWFRFLSVLSIIPAGALGGFVAELFKSVGGRAPGGGSPQRTRQSRP
jgi:putative membrane protein (TIGR04086 family)